MYIVDRIEGNKIILEDEDGRDKVVEKKMFSFNVKEGDVIEYIDGKYIFNNIETTKRRNNILKKFDELNISK